MTRADRKGHVETMDGLRGLAVLLVVLFHYWQLSFFVFRPESGWPNLEFIQAAGFLGVELFFFISGFCLFYPYATGRTQTLKHFYYRRAIKILPSYLLALLVFAFIIDDLYPSTWQYGKLADLGLHLVFLQNFATATHGSFNGVMWSLAVEVQFYLLFPLLAWLFRRQPLATAAGMIAIAWGYRLWNRTNVGDGIAFWGDLLPAFVDLFALGMLAAWLLVKIRERPEAVARLRLPMTAIAVLAFVLILYMFDWFYQVRADAPAELWRSANSTYVGALFLVLAVSSAFAFRFWRALLASRVLFFLSLISYNLYLWHQGIGRLIVDRGWWPADTALPTDDPTWRWSYFLVAVAASVLVATAITYLFERPLLRHGVRGSLRRLTPGGRTPESTAAGG